MQLDYPGRETIRELERDRRAIDTLLADLDMGKRPGPRALHQKLAGVELLTRVRNTIVGR